MVRKLNIKNVVGNDISQGTQETQETQETPTTTPEPEEHVNTPIETEVAVFEATHELPPDAANVESAATAVEPTTPKPKRPPRKKKEAPTTAVPPPETDLPAPEQTSALTSWEVEPEVEHPAEEIKIATKVKAKPRAKPKAKPVPTQDYPTYDERGRGFDPHRQGK